MVRSGSSDDGSYNIQQQPLYQPITISCSVLLKTPLTDVSHVRYDKTSHSIKPNWSHITNASKKGCLLLRYS